MSNHPLAGKLAPADSIVSVDKLIADYYDQSPDMAQPSQRVTFGTSGHRGKSSDATFTESHVAAIVQAVCDFRRRAGHTGPLFLGKDTHSLSDPAQKTAIEVLAANDVLVRYQEHDGVTPTPAISFAILQWNKHHRDHMADGLIITPSHNPPTDGGIKYNGPNGGGAGGDITKWIQETANEYLLSGLEKSSIRRISYDTARRHGTLMAMDFSHDYIKGLRGAVDVNLIAFAGLRIAVDPLGGAALPYWQRIRDTFGLDIHILNDQLDPTFRFMPLDHDGKIRMDCSSPYSMANLLTEKDNYDLILANDPDADRHGIVVPSVGLMNPNHYLSALIWYLFQHRDQWPGSVGVGKTVVSSSMIDRVTDALGRKLVEVPVGFKHFVPGLMDGDLAFGGEESAGATFLKTDGTVWTTEKDGLLLCLAAAEMIAALRQDPGQVYQELEEQFGKSYYSREDHPATAEQKRAFAALTPDKVAAHQLAGDHITAKLTHAPGNGKPIGGLKVVTDHGWFAARPSGTENIYKIYAESFRSEAHLTEIFAEAAAICAVGSFNLP